MCVTRAPAVPKIAGLLGVLKDNSARVAGAPSLLVLVWMPLPVSSQGHLRMLHAICICGPVLVIYGCKYPIATSTCEVECHTCAYRKQAQGYVTLLEAMRPFD